MKRLLLLAALFSFTFANSQTSVYHPFPDSNAVWNYFTSQFWCPTFPPGSIYIDYSITISGDTLINGTTYHKLVTPFVQYTTTTTCSPYIFSGYKGAIREDTTARMVYYVPPAGPPEQLLYDFNMQVGDTLQGYISSIGSGVIDTIHAIDSVLVGSDYRKRWVVNPCYNIYFIEGIGSTYGLFETSSGCITDGPGFQLTCFTQEGATLYPNTTMNCPLITKVDQVESVDYSLSLTPNPFHTTARLEANRDFDNAVIAIYDLQGKCIRKDGMMQQGSTIIKRDDLSPGVYLVQLTNNRGQIAVKRFAVE